MPKSLPVRFFLSHGHPVIRRLACITHVVEEEFINKLKKEKMPHNNRVYADWIANSLMTD